jgi:hypothetical protein
MMESKEKFPKRVEKKSQKIVEEKFPKRID